MNIHSPMPTGNGACVLHAQLAARIAGYQLQPYSPWWTLLPPALPLFSTGKADLVHASADYGLFFKRHGVPLVVTLHNYVCDSFMRPYSTALQYLHYRSDLRWFTRRTLAVADCVVAISQFTRDRVSEDLGVNMPMRLIYNGVDERRFAPSVGRRHAKGPFRVLFSGNLTRRKRAHLLPRLAAALGQGFEIHFTAGLAGNSSFGERPSNGAARLVNLGSLPHTEMPAVYRSVDALFMPSVREGFGLCVAEAMACGLPVVACRESALPELVEHGQGGMLCPVDDVECYANAMRELADDRRAAERMGDFNRERVERQFTLARMIREYRELFETVLDGATH